MNFGLSLGLSLGSRGPSGPPVPTILLSASSVLESALSGSTVGTLSVANVPDATGWAFAETADPDGKFAVSGTNLNLAAGLDFETAQSHSVTIQATKAGEDTITRTFTIAVLNVFEQPDLGALTLPAEFAPGATVNITGATAGSTITGTLPAGWTLNGGARTIAIAGDAAEGEDQPWSLTETLADSSNSPRTSAGFAWVRPNAEPTITIATPTWSLDASTLDDGTRLVAGDPNANYGLGATNPGNLGWDAITTGSATNGRFNPVAFQGQIRARTVNSVGEFTNIGAHLLAPTFTQSGPMYGQITVNARAESQSPTLAILATNESNYLGAQIDTSVAGNGAYNVIRTGAGSPTTVFGVAPGSTKVRLGGTNGQFTIGRPNETVTLLSINDGVNERAYLRREPGFPLGPTSGTTYTALSGNRSGLGSRGGRHTRTIAARVGPAPLFITVNETHRFWVPKKRASASDPITAGVGDETFTGTYVGTIPSRMQWALFNMGTGAVIKDWALVPGADFTASAGTWSARLRAIPSGLNGRGAYAVGFRPVDENDQTDPAWQCVSNREFYVTLNVGLIGQSNAAFLTNGVTTTAYSRVDGIASYTKADPPSVAQGAYNPNPRFWDGTTTGETLNGLCTYVLGDYLANLYNLPISFEVLAIPATGATNLGPLGANWSYIQTHHAFAGGAYDLLYLSQGENEFAASASIWLTEWVDTNLPAYRDPSFHGQPAGTVIPLLYAITGRFTGSGVQTNANAQIVRSLQYDLESAVSDCYLAHSYTGVEMVDTFHYVTTNGEGYNEVMRRTRLTYDHIFNAGAYDGRGPVATSVSRSGALLTVSFDLNGATSLVARDGRDQTLSGNASALTSWQVSADNFATLLTISSAVITGNTVVITLAADPGGPVRVRNHFGLNPDLSSFPAGSYADGTFICMMPLVNSLLSS